MVHQEQARLALRVRGLEAKGQSLTELHVMGNAIRRSCLGGSTVTSLVQRRVGVVSSSKLLHLTLTPSSLAYSNVHKTLTTKP